MDSGASFRNSYISASTDGVSVRTTVVPELLTLVTSATKIPAAREYDIFEQIYLDWKISNENLEQMISAFLSTNSADLDFVSNHGQTITIRENSTQDVGAIVLRGAPYQDAQTSLGTTHDALSSITSAGYVIDVTKDGTNYDGIGTFPITIPIKTVKDKDHIIKAGVPKRFHFSKRPVVHIFQDGVGSDISIKKIYGSVLLADFDVTDYPDTTGNTNTYFRQFSNILTLTSRFKDVPRPTIFASADALQPTSEAELLAADPKLASLMAKVQKRKARNQTPGRIAHRRSQSKKSKKTKAKKTPSNKPESSVHLNTDSVKH